MEQLINGNNGTTQLLAGIVIILCLHLVLKIGSLVWENYKTKTELSEKNIEQLVAALNKIETRISAMERDMNTVLKFRVDFKRLFTAVKFLAGDKWSEVRKAISEDDLPS